MRSRHAATSCATPRDRPAQLARALDPPPRELGFGARAHALPAVLALVERPLEPADRLEPFDERVLQREQVLDVGRGVDASAPRSAGGASSR